MPAERESQQLDPTCSALDLAAALIEATPDLDQMKLHKLLYLVQAAHLAWFEEPAFSEPIEAWIFGPVTRRVSGYYRQFGNQPITRAMGGRSDSISRRGQWVLAQITETYGHLDGFTLATLLKAPDSPWQRVREGLPDDVPSDKEIPAGLIAQYHKQHGLPLVSDPTSEETALAQRFFDGEAEAFDDLVESVTGVRPRPTS